MGDLLGPDPILLPGDTEAEAQLLANENPSIVAAAHPSASVAWAALAEEALADDKAVTAYAYARTGYHRGLDQLRRNGWNAGCIRPWLLFWITTFPRLKSEAADCRFVSRKKPKRS